MWIQLLGTYLAAGLFIVTYTSAKREMQQLGDGVTRPSNPFC